MLLLLGAAACADEPPGFVLDVAEGTAQKGPLAELSEKGTVRIGPPNRARREAGQWLTLRRAAVPMPAPPGGPHLALAGGDRLPVAPASLRLAGERLALASPFLNEGKATHLPLSAVSFLWLAAPDTADDGELVRRRLATEKRSRDAVLLRNGDVLEGVLEGLDDKAVQIKAADRRSTVELSRVAAVTLSTDLATPLRPKGTHYRLVLADGARLTLRSAACADGETLTGVTAGGAALGVPLVQVIALDVEDGPAIALRGLKPLRYEHTPYLSVAWPLGVDASVAGRDLRLGGGVFDRGLGQHSASRVAFAVPKGARRFEARVGLDDLTGRKGSVRVRVLVDGKEADAGLKGDLAWPAPHRVGVDVAGARELTLAVDFGKDGDVGDHVNWVDARFVR